MKDADVEELLLNNSDLEDIGQEDVEGDDIYSDPEFQPTEGHDDTSESDTEPEAVHDVIVTQLGTARGRTRGGSSSSRGAVVKDTVLKRYF